MKFLKKISDTIVNGLENGFNNYGRLVARRPVLFIIGPLIICVLCGLGFMKWNEVTAAEKLWVPQDSDFVRDQKWIRATFEISSRFQNVLFAAQPGENLLTSDNLLLMLDLYNKVHEFSVDYEDANGTAGTATWEDVCFRVPAGANFKCSDTNILELWNYDENVIKDLSEEGIFTTIRDTTVSPVFGNPFNYNTLLGKRVKNSAGEAIGAEAVQMQWLVRIDASTLTGDEYEERVDKRTLAWEAGFLETIDDFIENSLPDKLELYKSAGRSFGDISADAILGDLQLLFGGYVLVFLYVILVLGRRNVVEIKLGLALAGLLSIGLSILFSYGLSSGLGIFFGPLHQILPFLLLGVGIDNMFVIVQCYENLDDEEKKGSLPDRIGKTMKHAGAAITVTSGTDFAAFIIGSSTILPALQSFCLYAAIGILALYFLQCTFFTAWFVLDVKRVENKRNGILCCCYKHGDDYKPSECSKKDFTNVIFQQGLAKYTVTLPVKVLILTASLGLLGANIYGFTQLEQKFDPIWFLPSSSYLAKYFSTIDEQFPSGGARGSVYFSNISYHEALVNMADVVDALQSDTDAWMGDSSVQRWPIEFIEFINGGEIPANYPEEPLSEENFLKYMKQFLCTQGSSYRGNFLLEMPLDCKVESIAPIRASYLNFQHSVLDKSADKILAMKTTKDIIQARLFVSNTPDEPGAFAFSVQYANWITDEVIGEELLRNMILAAVCVFVMTLILIASVPTCLMVLVCVIFTLVDVIGTMHFWGLTLDTVSCVILVVAIGLCVDYSAHIGHTFMTLTGSRNERTRVTIEEIGPAVFHGGFSTFMAFILLSGSDSYVFTTFFKIFFCVVVFGLFHGLFFLPVMLSFAGPAPYSSAESALDRENTIKGHSGFSPNNSSINGHQKHSGLENGGYTPERIAKPPKHVREAAF